MPPTPSHPDAPVSRLIARLAALRGRIRRLVAVSGAARVTLLAVAFGALFFLADWGLDLPLSVRRFVRLGLLDRPDWLSFAPWVLLFGASLLLAILATRGGHRIAALFAFAAGGIGGVLVWAAARMFVEPLRIPLPDQELALSVEERFRHLNDRLVAALDFDRELANPSRGESLGMMAQVVDEAGREAEGLEFARLASGRQAWRRAGLASVAVVAAAGFALAAPDTVGLWARRCLGLENVSWPKSTSIEAVVLGDGGLVTVKDSAAPYVVALGQALTVTARAAGKVPSEVVLYDRLPDDAPDAKPLPHRMRPVVGRDGLFELEMQNVRSPFRFSLRGGDDQDDLPTYSVAVRVPPRVASLRSSLVFPEYLKLAPKQVDGGSFETAEGTEVTVSFETDTDVARAEATVEDRPTHVDGGPRSFSFRFAADKSLRWRLRLVTPDGRENDPASDTYDVQVQPDLPPRPEWAFPRGPLEATVKARIPLFARTHDDHGIASIVLEARVGTGPTVQVPLAQRRPDASSEANDQAYGSETILSYVPFELSTLKDAAGAPLAPPNRVSFRFVATDTKGQRGEGEWTTADLLRADELERALAGRRASVRSDLSGIQTELATLREAVNLLSRAPIGDPEKGQLREVQFKQGKARADIDRSVRGLANLFNSYVYDRLGAEAATEKVLFLMDVRHRALFAKAPLGGEGPAKDGAEATAPPEGDAAVFPWSIYREIVKARRDKIVFDTGILDKIVSVLDGAVECVETLAPAAYAAASDAAGRGTHDDLVALLAAQDRLLARLKDTLGAMADWQNLNDLILQVRRLIEDQEAVNGRIRGVKPEPKPDSSKPAPKEPPK